jgi:hypothetical protein
VTPPDHIGRTRRRATIIALAVLLTFWNTLSLPFVFDDQSSIVENQSIRHVERPSIVLFPEQDSPTAGRPLANASFAVNYAIGGLDVRRLSLGSTVNTPLRSARRAIELSIGCAKCA